MDEARWGFGLHCRLADDVGLERVKDLVSVGLGMNVQIDGLGKVKGENSHDRLSVDNVPSGYQIEIGIILGYNINK